MELDRILRLPEVVEVTGIPQASLYRRMGEKTFPRPVRLGKNSVGWRQSAIQAWLDSLKEVTETAQEDGSENRPRHPAARRPTRQPGSTRDARR